MESEELAARLQAARSGKPHHEQPENRRLAKQDDTFQEPHHATGFEADIIYEDGGD